jgi:hypothetical protein
MRKPEGGELAGVKARLSACRGLLGCYHNVSIGFPIFNAKNLILPLCCPASPRMLLRTLALYVYFTILIPDRAQLLQVATLFRRKIDTLNGQPP